MAHPNTQSGLCVYPPPPPPKKKMSAGGIECHVFFYRSMSVARDYKSTQRSVFWRFMFKVKKNEPQNLSDWDTSTSTMEDNHRQSPKKHLFFIPNGCSVFLLHVLRILNALGSVTSFRAHNGGVGESRLDLPVGGGNREKERMRGGEIT